MQYWAELILKKIDRWVVLKHHGQVSDKHHFTYFSSYVNNKYLSDQLDFSLKTHLFSILYITLKKVLTSA